MQWACIWPITSLPLFSLSSFNRKSKISDSTSKVRQKNLTAEVFFCGMEFKYQTAFLVSRKSAVSNSCESVFQMV